MVSLKRTKTLIAIQDVEDFVQIQAIIIFPNMQETN